MPRIPAALFGLALATLLQAQSPFAATPLAPSPVPVLKDYPDTPAGKLLRDIREHAEAHKADLDAIQAVLVHDMGTGMVKGFMLQGRENCRGLMAQAIAPLNDLGVKELSLRVMGSTDHAPFDRAGVPAFAAIQEPVDYFLGTHHSQMDFPDHVVPGQLVQGARSGRPRGSFRTPLTGLTGSTGDLRRVRTSTRAPAAPPPRPGRRLGR